MVRFWNSVIKAGVSVDSDRSDNRHTILCNRISIILSLFTFLTFVIAYFYFGWILSVKLALISTVFFLLPILLNTYEKINASRLFLSFSLSAITVIISVADKFDVPGMLEEFQYFQFRLLLLMACLFPFILFKLEEQIYWVTLFSINFIFLVLYDPIHELFGVGYYQVGFRAPNYYFLNYMVMTTFFVLCGSTYFLKYSFEKYERRNELLIKDLHKANKVISDQRESLTLENTQLNNDLLEANQQLTETNTELVRHNNDLLQFSYTVSHNLRGPVASLMGLIHLLKKEKPNEEESRIIFHVNKSLLSLNGIIQDISSIIDVRNVVVQVKQKVSFADEITNIHSLLIKQITDQQVVIETDFDEAPDIISVKPMISSILYNLVINAIKYRAPDRLPKIQIKTSIVKNFVRIDVTDNGLGIDLVKFKEKLFGLYKRFHTHTEGKGLGLFLVKLQSEALGGYVEVNSAEGVGTTFSVYINISTVAEEQVLLDTPLVKITFNANKNYLFTQWKRSVTATEFQEVSTHIADFMKNFRIPNGITDITFLLHTKDNYGEIRKEFQHKLQTYGTQRMAFIFPRSSCTQTEYKLRTDTVRDAYAIPVDFFDDLEKAISWVVKP